MQNAFTIIQAVYRKNQLMISEKFPCTVYRPPYFRSGRSIVIQSVVDSHRKSIGLNYSIPELCFVQFKVNTQYPFDSTDKMPHIVISMESYKVSIQ